MEDYFISSLYCINFKGSFMMYCSVISHIPMFVAMSLNLMMDAVGFISVGLAVEMAILKVIAVIKVKFYPTVVSESPKRITPLPLSKQSL